LIADAVVDCYNGDEQLTGVPALGGGRLMA